MARRTPGWDGQLYPLYRLKGRLTALVLLYSIHYTKISLSSASSAPSEIKAPTSTLVHMTTDPSTHPAS